MGAQAARRGTGSGVGPIRVLLLAAVLSSPVLAAEPTPLSGIPADAAWRAFLLEAPTGRVCYAASLPRAETGDYARRGPAYVTLGYWPAEGRMGEVAFAAGYRFDPTVPVTVEIALGAGEVRRFSLSPSGDRAWAADGAEDARLLAALRRGTRMTVTARSARGTLTTDTYSLAGSARAIARAARACGAR